MKRLLLSLAFVAAVFPVAASAQQNPPAPPTQAQRAQMRAGFEQMRKLHEQFRAQVLGALSPAHRQLLAQTIGDLAVAAHPDRKAAVAQLDAALSPGEKSAILASASQMRTQMKSILANMPHPQWRQKSGPMNEHWARKPGMRKPHQLTAGGILLMASGGGGHMMMGGFRGGMHGGPPPQHQQ